MSDLISRQAAIAEICEDIEWLESQGCTDITMTERKERDVDILADLPDAEPERKTGKWIGYNEGDPDWSRTDGAPIFLSCSECRGIVMNNASAHWNFCPKCGAKMEGWNG